jgi:hypothetical protein
MRFGESRYFGVQARTFQVLAMTDGERGSFFYIGIWVVDSAAKPLFSKSGRSVENCVWSGGHGK